MILPRKAVDIKTKILTMLCNEPWNLSHDTHTIPLDYSISTLFTCCVAIGGVGVGVGGGGVNLLLVLVVLVLVLLLLLLLLVVVVVVGMVVHW